MTTGIRKTLLRFGFSFGIAICLLVFPASLPQLHAGEEPAGGLPLGGKAPDFRAKASSGDDFVLQEIASKRKLVLLSFWGLRCGDCIEEIPSLNEAREKWGEKGLEVVGVNTDGIDADILNRQLRTIPTRPGYMLIVDPDLKIADAFKLKAAPLTVGITQGMEVVFIHSGFREGDAKVLEGFLSKFFSDTGQSKAAGQ